MSGCGQQDKPVPSQTTSDQIGFIGLGHMGSALATNLVRAGLGVVAYDKAGTAARAPVGAAIGESVGDVAGQADVIVLSLPDAWALADVIRGLVAAREAGAPVRDVVDTSTVGIEAALEAVESLGAAGIAYVDAPVSGGVAGAVNRTIAVMFSGSDDAFRRVQPVLDGLSDRVFRIGAEPGLGQAVKIANNFLSATALAATSEAVAFGRAVGVDPSIMIDVINASSGRNSATEDKFPNQILTHRYGSGFSNALMNKDLQLYIGAVETRALPAAIGRVTASVWDSFGAAEPGADFTRIFPFVIGDRIQ